MGNKDTGSSLENGTPSNIEQESESGFFSMLPHLVRDRLRDKTDFTQKESFDWSEEMVDDRSSGEKARYGTDIGLQATVEFDGTDYRKPFDETVELLRSFARKGKEHTGWSTDGDPERLYGRTNRITVNGREYEVIEETTPEGKVPAVSIRGVYVRDESGQWHTKDQKTGAYYFRGVFKTRKGLIGNRSLELCGAKAPISDVKGDIKEIIRTIKSGQ